MPFCTHSAAFVNSASDLRILVGAGLPSFHDGIGTFPLSEGDSTHMTFCRAIAALISETHIHILYIPQIQNSMKVAIQCGISHKKLKTYDIRIIKALRIQYSNVTPNSLYSADSTIMTYF
jgi:hypothetical protein